MDLIPHRNVLQRFCKREISYCQNSKSSRMRVISSLLLSAGLFTTIASAAWFPLAELDTGSRNKTRSHKPKPGQNTGTLPPQIASVEIIDLVTDNAFNPSIYRDGGGGGYINGYNVISFADSYTTAHPGLCNSNLTSFVHNSFAYFGYVSIRQHLQS